MSKVSRIILVVLLLVCLVALRAFASAIFYDPLIVFFKSNHVTQAVPEMNIPKLLLHLSLRFLGNTIISLAILWLLFQKRDIVKLSAFLYGIAFLILLLLFYLVLNASENESYMLLFYVRRFLIHPIFLLLLIPAFYFQQSRK